MSGENYPGKLWMQCVTTSPDASTFESDGVTAIDHIPGSPGFYFVHLAHAVDPDKVRIAFDAINPALVPANTLALQCLWSLMPDRQTIVVLWIGVGQNGDQPNPGLFTAADTWGAIAACGVPLCPAFGAGAPIDYAGPFNTSTLPRRGVQFSRLAPGPQIVFTVDGRSVVPYASPIVETVTMLPVDLVARGVFAYETIARVRSDVDPTAPIQMERGPAFELTQSPTIPTPPGEPAGLVLAVDGTPEAWLSVSPSDRSIVPTTAPDGLHGYAVRTIGAALGLDGGPFDCLWSMNITRLQF